MTEIPITSNQLLTIERPNQLITVRYRGIDRLVDIIDTLNDNELNELREDYDLGEYEDINKAIKMRIRGLQYKKYSNKNYYIYVLIFIMLLGIILAIVPLALYFGQ